MALCLRALTGLLLIAVMAGGIAALHMRAGARDATVAADPLPVAVVRPRLEEGYHVTERFAGRLEPRRTTPLAFERGGLVTRLYVDEGDEVAVGEVVARMDVMPLLVERDRLRAQQEQIHANLELARLTLDRQSALQQQGHASTQRLDEARLAVAALEADVTSVAAGIRLIEIEIGKSTLRAPYGGTIASRDVDEGTVVSAGLPVAALLETGRPRARIGVSPQVGAALVAGATYGLRAAGGTLPARLVGLRPDVEPDTRTVTALFGVDHIGDLSFGEVVELEVSRFVAGEGFWLPTIALTEGARGLWTVYVADEGDGESGPTVVREAVEVLHATEGRVFVRGTLRPGADVVIGGQQRVVPGQRVVVAGAADWP